jgi:hypothetical protein
MLPRSQQIVRWSIYLLILVLIFYLFFSFFLAAYLGLALGSWDSCRLRRTSRVLSWLRTDEAGPRPPLTCVK